MKVWRWYRRRVARGHFNEDEHWREGYVFRGRQVGDWVEDLDALVAHAIENVEEVEE